MKEIKHKKLKIAVFSGLLAAYALRSALRLPCLFLLIFKTPCPTCGITRAWLSVLRLDFAEAFAFHPLFWSIPVLALYAVFDGRLFKNRYLNYGLLIAIALGFLIYFILGLIDLEYRVMIYIK